MGLNRPNIADMAQKFVAFRASGATFRTIPAAPAAKSQEANMAKVTKTKNIGTKRASAALKGVPVKAKITRKVEVAGMLRRAKGATVEQVCEKTGMLPHSARALISQLGETITTEKNGKNATVYFIKAAA